LDRDTRNDQGNKNDKDRNREEDLGSVEVVENQINKKVQIENENPKEGYPKRVRKRPDRLGVDD
jgi:hypothetical protein